MIKKENIGSEEIKEVKETNVEKTWCRGCTNFGILSAFKKALTNLVKNNRIKLRNVVIVTGIGCHAKIFDYLNLNAYYSLHGRVIPTLLGIKLGNPELIPIGFGGDGYTYSEGMCHFVHGCRHNSNIKIFVHNNQTFALTTGQATPTSEFGFKGSSTPLGNVENPINPIALALSSGATFVARGYSADIDHLANIMEEAIEHKGFSYVDILQPCITYHNTIHYFKDRLYKLDLKDLQNYENAMNEAMKWDYSLDKNVKIPIGIFYKVEKPTLENKLPHPGVFLKLKKSINKDDLLEDFI